MLDIPAATQEEEVKLANIIRNDPRLALVRTKARQLASKELTAGTGYASVWIRDLNTFIELAIEGQGPQNVRVYLKQFLVHQADDGNIVDEIRIMDGSTSKNTVESDQESSLVQAVAKFVVISNDNTLLLEKINSITVIERLENALIYLYKQRYSSKYGLVFGATRADWGDVQPEDPQGAYFNALTHPSISIYDNAMLILALKSLQIMELRIGRDASVWFERERNLRAAIRAHLWTGIQFIPHIYLEKGSPFPAKYDEASMYFQGGTGVAIQAGLLEPAEIKQTFIRMIKNKNDSGSGSIGVSLYPAYPAGFFKNAQYMGLEYVYQNGGDWPWFGARIIQQMVEHDQVEMAYKEITPMLTRVLRDGAFYEWYTPGGIAMGSGDYRGTAGQLANAIDMLLQWAATR